MNNDKIMKKLDKINKQITLENLLNAIKQNNDNQQIEKELETYMRKITKLNDDELKVLTAGKNYLGLQLHNVDNPEVITILNQFMKHEAKIEKNGEYQLIEYELD